MKKVIVHIGAHKTGTSSIQAAMAGYDDGRTIYARFDPSNHSIAVTTIFARAPHDYHIWRSQGLSPERVATFQGQYRAVLDAHLADTTRDTLIISGEDIGILDDAEKQVLVDHFVSRGLELQIVCFVRDPRSLTASAIQQHIKNGMAKLAPLDPGYRLRLGFFADMLPPGNLLVNDYAEAVARHGDIVKAFAHVCGIEPPAVPAVRHNESLSQSATKLILRFNRLPISTVGTPARVRARDHLVRLLSRLYPVTDATLRIDGRMTEALADVLPDELAFLAQRFGITYPPPKATTDPAACDAFFHDLRDVEVGVLRTELMKRGLPIHRRTPLNTLLTEAFYDGLYASRLEDGDVPFLRDLAIEVAAGKAASLKDAIALMLLAQRARPDGPKINALIETWQRQLAETSAPLSLARADIQE